MRAWYNEIDPFAAEWLRCLIKAGHIAPGVVDTRDIRDISPHDLDGFTQLHFFAGIGGWSLALRQAGWPDDRPVWTGSCPCQPFSNSGLQRGFDDDRHLWPVWFDLIKARRPATLFGEQVASKPALAWFDLVSADLETAGYTVGAADLCAAGLGAPHIRQRLWFGATRWMANADGACVPNRLQDVQTASGAAKNRSPNRATRSDRSRRLGDTNSPRSQGWAQKQCSNQRSARTSGLAGRSPWETPDWVWCQDHKWRPVEPGLCPLADGFPSRVGRLRAYGNAIVPQVGAAFVHAFEQSRLTQ